MRRPLLAVDAPSLYYRAFYGVPDSLTAPDGTVIATAANAIQATGSRLQHAEVRVLQSVPPRQVIAPHGSVVRRHSWS